MTVPREPRDTASASAPPPHAIRSGPATGAQRALWLAEQFDELQHAYHINGAHRVAASLDVGALQAAVALLGQRHPIFRTSFHAGDGEASVLQAVATESSLALEIADGPDVESELIERMREWAARPFASSMAPMARFKLWRVGTAGFVLQSVFHHLLVDGWGRNVVLDDLASLYAALAEGRSPEPHEAACDPIAAAEQQQRARETPEFRERLDALAALVRDTPAIDLPLDRTPGRNRSVRAIRSTAWLEAEATARVQKLAGERMASPIMLILAVWHKVLSRFSAQHDFAIGMPVANRPTHAEQVATFLATMLPVRPAIAGDLSLEDTLEAVRDQVIESLEGEGVPLDVLLDTAQSVREAGRHPLFQVAFSTEPGGDKAFRLGDLAATAIEFGEPVAKFELTLYAEREGARFKLVLDGAADLFTHHTVDSLVSEVARVLEGLTEAGMADDGALAWSEAQALVGPPRRVAIDSSGLFECFARVAERQPNRPAVTDGAHRLTYGELAERVQALAAGLTRAGVGPGCAVGVAMDRGWKPVAAMLAILRAGGHYVALDPMLPDARFVQIAHLAGVALIMDDDGLSRYRRELLMTVGRPVRTVAELTSAGAGRPVPAAAVDASDLAYVMFTSGSTGMPKGVEIRQSSVSALVLGQPYLDVDDTDVIAQVSTLAFDAATFEIWGALLNGLELVVLPTDTVLDVDALASEIARHRITTMFLTTALFNVHVQRRPDAFAGLRRLLFGGEKADSHAVRRALGEGGPQRLVHVYGPTETTTFTTAHELTAIAEDGRVPIGRPLAGVSLRIVDEQLRPLPAGWPGELLIGGAGLARGYIGDQAATRQAFVDNVAGGERWYRTGDIVRSLPDGTVEFIGRRDAQVKIAGYRIEIDEITRAIRAIDGVDAAHVLMRGGDGDKRLIAFVVGPSAPAPHDILARLRLTLPTWMLPARIVPVDLIPLTANGKVDQTRLMQLDPGDGADQEDGGPSDDIERSVQEAWAHVLGRSSVGLDVPFLEAGGSSLVALRLLSDLERRFDRTLHLRDLIRAATVREQAALLRGDASARDIDEIASRARTLVPVRAAGAQAPLFFVSGYGGTLLPLQALAAELPADRPFHVLDLNAVADDADQDCTLETLAERMVADIDIACPEGPVHLAGFSLGGRFVFEIARQLQSRGRPPGALIMIDCGAPGYPPAASRLWRLVLNTHRAAGQGPRALAGFVRSRLRQGVRRLLPLAPRLFEPAQVREIGGTGQAMERAAEITYRAWRAYSAKPYDGSLGIVRAGVRTKLLGIDDSDRQLGWGKWVNGEIDIVTMHCLHGAMIYSENAGVLASLLEELIQRREAVSESRRAA